MANDPRSRGTDRENKKEEEEGEEKEKEYGDENEQVMEKVSCLTLPLSS